MATNPVAEPSARWNELEALRAILRPLASTLSMRAAGTALLPPHEGEALFAPSLPNQVGSAPEVIGDHGGFTRTYQIRLSRAVLNPAFAEAMVTLAGKVFRRPIGLDDTVPPKIAAHAEDIDRRGNNLHNFALDRFLRALWDGFSLVLVDAPRAATPDAAKKRTSAEEAVEGIRPFVVPYGADQLLGIRTDVVNGRWRLTQARLYDCALEPAGEFGEAVMERVRVFASPASGVVMVQTWKREKGSQDDYKPDGEPVPILGVREIPLVPIYGNIEHGFFDAAPGFMDLAMLNIRDWQIQSDVDNILRVGMVPKPYIAGGSLPDEVKWSVDEMLEFEDPQARILFAKLEVDGVEAAVANLERGRDLMAQLALKALLPMRGGKITAEEVQIRTTDSISPLQALALGLKDSLNQVLRFMAQYHRAGDDAGGSVTLSGKLFVSARDVIDIKALETARKGVNGKPDIGQKTYLENLKRLTDALPEDADIDELIEEAEQESRASEILRGTLDDLGADPEDGDPNADEERTPPPARAAEPGDAGERAA